MNKIDGGLIKEHLINLCQPLKEELENKEISIIRFTPPENSSPEKVAQYEAARISAEQKIKTFDRINVKPNYSVLKPDQQTNAFEELIESVNSDPKIVAAIVQYPVPEKFRGLIKLLDPSKDIDCVRLEGNELFSSPATAEGISKIVDNYAQSTSRVAVIGGNGFIGRGVVNYLDQKDIDCFVLEIDDDKSRTREADIVVSVTGVPGNTTPYILPQHRLVVDGGFTATPEGPRGDVDKSAYSIPQNITPVPGGIGPTEMAILANRFVKMSLDIELPEWNYQQLKQEQQELAPPIALAMRQVFDHFTADNPDILNSEKFLFEGRNYDMKYTNKEEGFLDLSRSNNQTTLLKLNLDQNQIVVARGLTNEDRLNWQEYSNYITQQQQNNRDRGLER